MTNPTDPQLVKWLELAEELQEVWDTTASLPRLRRIADVHRGVEYKESLDSARQKYISSEPRLGFSPGLDRADLIEQFAIRQVVYLNTSPEVFRTKAQEHPWERPKVIVNASRRSRGRWKLSAATDRDGLVCYQRLDGVWPKGDYALDLLAAVLNGPVASAYVAVHEAERDVRVQTIEGIPIPSFSSAQMQSVARLVEEYRLIRQRWLYGSIDPDVAGVSCKQLLEQIDAEVLKAYDLPPRVERLLLDFFWHHQRPVPFKFTGYIPPTFKPHIPWHFYISPAFADATVEATLERLPVVEDELIAKVLEGLD